MCVAKCSSCTITLQWNGDTKRCMKVIPCGMHSILSICIYQVQILMLQNGFVCALQEISIAGDYSVNDGWGRI